MPLQRPLRRLALALGLWLGLGLGAPLRAEEPAGEPDLVIVHTNDLHAHYRSFPDRQGALSGGFARLAWRIGQLRERYGDRLLYLDAGDLFVGTPFYHVYRGALGMALLDRMGCDAMALGNHELDDGSVNFLRAAVGARFPRLCANLDLPDGTPFLPASTLLTAGPWRVEVVGLITRSLPELSAEAMRGELLVRPPAEALADWLAAPRPAADLRVALSHCGLGEDREIAAAVPAVPVILGGHSHSFLKDPERVGDVTVCQTGCYGYNLGVLECRRRPDGSWDLRDRLEPVTADWPEDPAIAALIAEAGVPVDREMKTVLGLLPEAFDGAGKSDGADPLGQLLAELMRRAAGADLGLQNVGGYRTFLPAGPVLREKLFELLPFDNRVLRLHMDGNALRALFDRLADNRGGYRYAQVSGADYTVADSLALSIRVGGEPLVSDRDYTLATLDFLFGGGDGYGEILHLASQVDTLDVVARDLLEEALLRGEQPRPSDFPANVHVED